MNCLFTTWTLHYDESNIYFFMRVCLSSRGDSSTVVNWRLKVSQRKNVSGIVINFCIRSVSHHLCISSSSSSLVRTRIAPRGFILRLNISRNMFFRFSRHLSFSSGQFNDSLSIGSRHLSLHRFYTSSLSWGSVWLSHIRWANSVS